MNDQSDNNVNSLIGQIIQFCVGETQELIADLEQERFKNNGEFNGHKKWADNQSRKHPLAEKSVQEDKGFNKPLYDTGNLYKELSTPGNWDVKPQINKNTLKLTVPSRENFTDSKYDKLDVGVDHFTMYRSIRGNLVAMDSIPARPFKDISDQDAEWIANKLAQAIENQFG